MSDSTLHNTEHQTNSMPKVAFASFIGTAVEFYDFYIYGLAAATFLGTLFFPSEDKGLQVMLAFLTFGIAFLARPIGSALFGHFGDKVGRKATLIGSLLIMGLSTTLIGFLPTYSQAGIIAPILLCIMRFGQGLGLGGEWGGAALLATENAPKGKRALFAMFPQIGPPIGFIVASAIFIFLIQHLSEEKMLAWGWRIPFILSIVLIALGLYVRLSIIESNAFRKMVEQRSQAKVPLLDIIKLHYKELILGSFSAMSCFTLFFLTTVYSLQYATTNQVWQIHPLYSKIDYLYLLMIAIVFMGLASPVAAWLSEHFGRRPTLIGSGIVTIIIGLFFGQFMNSSHYYETLIFLSFSLFVMGILFTPLAAFLPEIFPTNVRYTGASITFSFGGILGGSLTPTVAVWLINHYQIQGIERVGWFLAASAVISIIAVLLLRETKHIEIEQ